MRALLGVARLFGRDVACACDTNSICQQFKRCTCLEADRYSRGYVGPKGYGLLDSKSIPQIRVSPAKHGVVWLKLGPLQALKCQQT